MDFEHHDYVYACEALEVAQERAKRAALRLACADNPTLRGGAGDKLTQWVKLARQASAAERAVRSKRFEFGQAMAACFCDM